METGSSVAAANFGIFSRPWGLSAHCNPLKSTYEMRHMRHAPRPALSCTTHHKPAPECNAIRFGRAAIFGPPVSLPRASMLAR